MSDLLYSVGIDPTTLDTGVAAVEARLAESGVIMAEVPAKYAKASADAFNQVYSAEEKLAAYRKQTAFDRLSDEEKIAVLRSEAQGLFEQIQASEGRSAENASLQLQYEQKKSQIYELNESLIAAQNEALAVQTAEQEANVGLMETLNGWGNQVKGAFHEMGVRLHGAGIGLIIAEVVNLTKQAVEEAQKQRDAYEKLGKPLDYGTQAMARLGDAASGAGKFLMSIVTAPVRGFAELGQVVGSVINRVRGISEAQEESALASERAADAAEAHIEKLKEEQTDVEKVSSARKELADAQRQASIDAANDTGKMQLLIARELQLQEQIKTTKQGTVLYYQREKELLENTTALEKATLDYVKRTAEIQLEAIKTNSPLDITYREKFTTLLKEERVLMGELINLDKDSADYEKVSNELRQNGVAQLQLQRQWRQKAALDQASELELARDQIRGLGNLNDGERAHYDLLVMQKNEKALQLQIDELLEKRIEAGLTPAEDARLKALLKQSDNLQQQIDLKEALIGTTGDVSKSVETETAHEREVTAELQRQLELLGLVGQVKNKQILIEGGVLGLHNLGGISSDTLQAEQKQLQDQMNALIREYQQKGYTRDARLDNYNLQSQIDSISAELKFRDDFQSAYAKGGRAGALNDYIAAGRDALSFDTALANMSSWSKGQDLTNQKLDTLNKNIVTISGQLATSTLFTPKI